MASPHNGNDPYTSGANGIQFARAARRDSIYNYDMGNDDDLGGLIKYLQMLKDHGCQISSLAIYDHGVNGVCQEYNREDICNLKNAFFDMRTIGQLMTDDGVIHMMGCNVGENAELLQAYADAFNRSVTGSSMVTLYNPFSIFLNWYRVPFTVKTRSPRK